jgi:hypothetical protein
MNACQRSVAVKEVWNYRDIKEPISGFIIGGNDDPICQRTYPVGKDLN